MSDLESGDLLEMASQNLTSGLVYLNLVNGLFRADTSRALDLANDAKNRLLQDECEIHEFNFYFRMLTRAFFAEIEGDSYTMRRIVLWANERSEIQLSDAELFELTEGERGVPLEKGRRRNSFLQNFELAFRYFPRLFGSEFTLSKGDTGWQTFRRAVAFRDSITHPKGADAFLPPTQTLVDVQKSLVWFATTMQALFRSIGATRG